MIAFLQKNLFTVAIAIMILVCACLILPLSGFYHESTKIRSILVSVFLVIVLLFLVGDTIKFLLLAIDRAFWPRKLSSYTTDGDATIHTRTDYLKLRLNTLRYQLLVTEEHRNEKLNLMYQNIAKDLMLYGKYFFLLMCLVLVTRDKLLYYNTHFQNQLFMNNQTYSMGLKSVSKLKDVYPFIESSVVSTFDPNTTETGNQNWFYGDHTSKLGVVRLRQLRRKENFHTGWDPVEFSNIDYMPKWRLPYQRMQYTDKYWRIYEPWLPISPTFSAADKILYNFVYDGYFQNYPELQGYVTLLSRSYNNSMKVVNYLEKNNWLTYNTSAVFMDFTLFNVDANIFTICTLVVEKTPFGTVVSTASIVSAKMLLLAQLGTVGLIILVVYIIVVIQFAKTVVLTLWFEPFKFRSMWTKLDLLILVLNITVITLVSTQEIIIAYLLAKVESSSKLEFLDFRLPARLHEVTSIMIGFLVCFTTLRLWRVLKFAKIFQLFSATLYSAWQALASTAMIIVIFLIGFGMASVIINGNNALSFSQLFKSIATSLCFSFGFSSHLSPNDLFYGGHLLGLVLYFILVFFVVLLMMNLFVSIINDYFTNAKTQQEAKNVQRINFLQFLRVEYAGIFRFFHSLKCFNKAYKQHNRTVSENIKRVLDNKDRISEESKYDVISKSIHDGPKTSQNNEQVTHASYKLRIERLFTVAAIMQTQMELLEHLLFKDESVYLDISEDAEDEDSEYEDTDSA